MTESRVLVFVKLLNGETEVYFDRSAKYGVIQTAIIAGGQAFVMWARSLEKLTEDNMSSVKSSTLDGAIYVNTPEKLVIWSGSDSQAFLARLLNHLFARSWFGWRAVWAPEGEAVVSLSTDFPFRFAARPEMLQISEHSTLIESLNIDPDEYASGIVSVRDLSGELHVLRSVIGLYEIAYLQPARVIDFVKQNSIELNSLDFSGTNTEPRFGIHIDEASHVLSWWVNWAERRIDQAFDRFWSGWSVTPLGDNFEWHAAELGGIKLFPSLNNHIFSAMMHFEQTMATLHNDDQIGALVEMCEYLWLSSVKLPTHLDGLPRSGQNVEYWLQLAIEELFEAPNLAPAKFIDRHGIIRG